MTDDAFRPAKPLSKLGLVIICLRYDVTLAPAVDGAVSFAVSVSVSVSASVVVVIVVVVAVVVAVAVAVAVAVVVAVAFAVAVCCLLLLLGSRAGENGGRPCPLTGPPW